MHPRCRPPAVCTTSYAIATAIAPPLPLPALTTNQPMRTPQWRASTDAQRPSPDPYIVPKLLLGPVSRTGQALSALHQRKYEAQIGGAGMVGRTAVGMRSVVAVVE